MSTTEKQANATQKTERVIFLDEPIKRGEQSINQITIRKPMAGELRGVSLVDLANVNVAALQIVLPRITAPTLTAHEVGRLDPADLLDIGAEVAAFLVKKADRLAVTPSVSPNE